MKKPIKAKRPEKSRVALPPLELKERERLADLLNDPVMQNALMRVGRLKPGVFFSGAGTAAHEAKTPEMASHISNNRMHEIRGWEMFETALYAQVNDPIGARANQEEDYQPV